MKTKSKGFVAEYVVDDGYVNHGRARYVNHGRTRYVQLHPGDLCGLTAESSDDEIEAFFDKTIEEDFWHNVSPSGGNRVDFVAWARKTLKEGSDGQKKP